MEAARTEPLQTVTRLRDACRIGHRLTRSYSELRKHGRGGELVSLAAYPVMWLSYMGISCVTAGSTVHYGVASLFAPNPVARPERRLWRGVVLGSCCPSASSRCSRRHLWRSGTLPT